MGGMKKGAAAQAARIRAGQCLAVGALGDALGYLVEFAPAKEIVRQFGEGGPKYPLADNVVALASDDTQMTLFAFEAVDEFAKNLAGCHSEIAAEALASRAREAYLDWFRTQSGNYRRGGSGCAGELADQFPSLWARRAPGNTCLSALARGANGTREHPSNDSKGCGSVMRAAPFGMAPLLSGIGLKSALAAAEMQSFCTHGNPEAAAASRALAMAVALGLEGDGMKEALSAVAGDLDASWPESSTGRLLRAALASIDEEWGVQKLKEELGEGWVADEALAIGARSALRAAAGKITAGQALSEASFHDGDSDSTASIAGNLLGAFGLAPEGWEAWGAKLDVADVLAWAWERMDLPSPFGGVAGAPELHAESEDAESRFEKFMGFFGRRKDEKD